MLQSTSLSQPETHYGVIQDGNGPHSPLTPP
jgi:hypothetical protein